MKNGLSLLVLAGLLAPVGAATLIDWDGRGNAGLTANLAITEVTTFSTASFQSPPSDGTDGYPGTVGSPDFYSAVNDAGVSGYTVFNGGANDLIGRSQAPAANSVFNSMLAWDIAGATFESAQMFGFGRFGGTAGANIDSYGYRYLVQTSDDQWYATNTVFTAAGTTVTANIESWVTYTPHNSGAVSFGTTVIGGGAIDFTAAKMAGYYQEYATNASGGGGVYASAFIASGVAVPEPSLHGLLGLGLIGLVARRKRA